MVFALVMVLSGGAVAVSFVTAETNLARDPAAGGSGTVQLEDRLNSSNVDDSAVASENLTVVSTQGFYVSDEQAELVAFSEGGEVVYYEDRYRVYFDVDPVPEKKYTVEFLASKHYEGEDCANVSTERCTYNVFERVNLSTGETREIYGELTPRIYSARWHDLDRVNDTHVVIADIIEDSVRVMNRTSGETAWEWNASEHYSEDAGGKRGDWTHVNDVEVLPDGRFMASMRNMDEVLFIDPGSGVDENWTLGEDDNHDILYEQHNPDYIPESEGGPAVIVADSENARVVEFQRKNGSWERTWGWRDSQLQWPRDADRLPNDNTLIVDSHGDRVLEVEPNGNVVWNVSIGMAYDVERLGTGDESTGGRSMTAIGMATDDIRRPSEGVVASFWISLKDLTPPLVVNGLLYSAPSWFRFQDLVYTLVFVLFGLTWTGTEIYWSTYSPVGFVRSLPQRVRSR
jgi:hypothetical protein